MRSIRHELSVRILAGSVLLLVVASAILGFISHAGLLANFDDALESKARALATLAIREGQTIEVDFAGEYMPEFQAQKNPEYFQFRLHDGSVIERSDQLGTRDLPLVSGQGERPLFRNLRMPDGRRGRLVQIAFPPRSEGQPIPHPEDRFSIPAAVDPETAFVILGVARSREDLDRQIWALYLVGLAVDLVWIVLTGLLIRWTAHKGFRPIEEMNTQIRRYDPAALEQRIELVDAPVELQTVLSTLNNLLDRVQSAFARERRFSSDVAHELRTPIAELRAACEVGSKWPDDPELVRDLYADILSATLHMERIVTGLMKLALCDSGRAQPTLSGVEVAPMVEACWLRMAGESENRGLRLANRIPPARVLRTDRDMLEMIIHNLLGNALAYATPGTEVECESPLAGEGLQLCIRNETVGLRPEDLDHVFERFWRKQHWADGEGNHSGLGLAIVKSLADILGIDIHVGLDQGHRFEARLSFPAEAAR
jgi:two-component system sensor histidine kinase QseC